MKLSHFSIGIIGMSLIAISAPIYCATYFLVWMYILPFDLFSPFFGMTTATAIIMFIGFIIASVGFYGYYKAYGQIWGLVGFLFPILFGWTLFLVDVRYLIAYWFPWLPSPWFPGLSFTLIVVRLYWRLKLIFLGITSIVWSVAVFKAAPFTGTERRTIIVGALLLVTGSVYLSLLILEANLYMIPSGLFYLVFGIGFILLCLDGLLNSIVFLSAKIT